MIKQREEWQKNLFELLQVPPSYLLYPKTAQIVGKAENEE